MKKKNIIWIVVAAVVVVIAIWLIASYNKMVTREETTSQAWANVENVYQRRMDLIPNLIKTVQGAADFEKSTLNEVISARSKVGSVQVDPNKLDETSIAQF